MNKRCFMFQASIAAHQPTLQPETIYEPKTTVFFALFLRFPRRRHVFCYLRSNRKKTKKDYDTQSKQ